MGSHLGLVAQMASLDFRVQGGCSFDSKTLAFTHSINSQYPRTKPSNTLRHIAEAALPQNYLEQQIIEASQDTVSREDIDETAPNTLRTSQTRATFSAVPGDITYSYIASDTNTRAYFSIQGADGILAINKIIADSQWS